MKTATVWLSGILFGLGLVCVGLWASDTECRTDQFSYVCKGNVPNFDGSK